MRGFRRVLGFGALAFLTAGFNLLVLKETLFTAPVYVALGVGVASGIVWFLMTAAGKIEEGKGPTLHGINTAVGVIVFLAICITLYAFAKRWDASWDLTQEGRRQLAPQTVQVLEGLKTPVEVTCFFVFAGDDRVYTAQQKTRRFLEQCQRHTDKLAVEFIDPQKDPGKLEAMNALRADAEIKSVRGVGTVVIRGGTKQREIPLSDVLSRLEERDFTNALINVSQSASPKVYFLTGHNERDLLNQDPKEGGSDFKLWLEKESYAVERLLIPYTSPVIPSDCSVLVIDGYEKDLLPHEIEALDQYMLDGGRLLLLANPHFILNPTENIVEQLRPWLQGRLGVVVGTDIVASPATNGLKILLVPDFNDEGLLGQYAGGPAPGDGFRGSFNTGHPITRGFDSTLVLSLARTVSLADPLPEKMSGMVLLRSTPDTWAETNLAALQNEQKINPDPEDTKGPNPVAVAVTLITETPLADTGRFKDARAVVVGDADLASNEGIDSASNSNFLLNSIAWLTESEDLLAIRPTGKEDPAIVLSQGEQQAIAWISALGTTQAVALAGALMYLRRRRFQ